MYLSSADMASRQDRQECREANLDLAISKRQSMVAACHDMGRIPPPKPACPFEGATAREDAILKARWAACP